MRNYDFGTYQATPRTVWRDARDRLEPSVRMLPGLREDLEAITAAEKELGFLGLDEGVARKVRETGLEQNVYATLILSGRETTLDEVRSILSRRPAAALDGGRIQREVLNHAALHDRLTDLRMPERPEDLAALHRDLFTDIYPDAGRFRTDLNCLPAEVPDEVGFVPALPERVVPELETTLDWLRRSTDPPSVRAAILSHEIQTIQPFARGNNRVARMLHYVTLGASGCVGPQYALFDQAFLSARRDYTRALVDAERQRDHTPWVAFAVKGFRRGYEDAMRRFMLHQQIEGDLNDRQWRVAEWFARRDRDRPAQEYRFSEIHAAFPDIPERTLQRDLAMLREVRVVVMEGRWKAARYRFVPQH